MDLFLDAIRGPLVGADDAEGGSRVDCRSLPINEKLFAQHAFAI